MTVKECIEILKDEADINKVFEELSKFSTEELSEYILTQMKSLD